MFEKQETKMKEKEKEKEKINVREKDTKKINNINVLGREKKNQQREEIKTHQSAPIFHTHALAAEQNRVFQ